MPDEEGQRIVYKALAEAGYNGVLAVHCEKESLFRAGLWDATKPYTWGLARPREAEIESVRDQIRIATECGVKAHLHICHISVPDAVLLVDEARKGMRISCGATPHHLTLSAEDMLTADRVEYKVNPPIRKHSDMKRLRELLKAGKIDLIETDHAPHTPSEKAYGANKPGESYMSGIQSLGAYASFLEGLKKDGFTDGQISRLTYENVKRVFAKIVE